MDLRLMSCFVFFIRKQRHSVCGWLLKVRTHCQCQSLTVIIRCLLCVFVALRKFVLTSDNTDCSDKITVLIIESLRYSDVRLDSSESAVGLDNQVYQRENIFI